MAETVEVNEEEAFGKWLEGMNSEEEQPEVVEEEEDPVELVKKVDRKMDALIAEKKTDEMVDEFMARAPEGAKDLFSIWRKGDEDPKQLKALMELANVKDQETAAQTAPVIEEEAEQKAAEIAREQYGVGPISSAQQGPALTPEQRQYAEYVEKVEKSGDAKALLSLLSEDSEFITSALTGGEIRKGQR